MQGRIEQVINNEKVTAPTTVDLSQSELVTHINLYFAKLKRPLWEKRGICHGIALVWQQKMADYMEEKFYAVIQKIIQHPLDKLEELDDDLDVQKFIAQIEYAQNIHNHNYGRVIKQKDVDLILDAPSELYSNAYHSKKSLINLLDNNIKDRPSVTVTSQTQYKHSIAIYFRDDKFYVYDANYETGRAKIFDTSFAVVNESTLRLYEAFGLKTGTWRMEEVIMVKPIPSPPFTKKITPSITTVTLFTPTTPLEVKKSEEAVFGLKHT